MNPNRPTLVDAAATTPAELGRITPAAPMAGGASGMSLPAIPGFLVEAELGRGGMGVVYRAKQLGLDRTVALKMILRADFASAEQRLRFQIEAENAARVQHPNIVQVHEIGEHQGQPYFALEFVAGGTLADHLQVHRLTPAEAAALVETLARAVHAAHLQGIIHRDLKPANILLASPGRESGECTPKIADFGLAKRMDSAPELTGSGDALGTPAYMAPEQARGDTKHLGPAADQYALGVIFYQLLANRLPFEAVTIPALLKKIAEDEPAPPRRRNGAVPPDLEVICLKALAKEPGQRYSSADAFADDLKNWRERRPITARPAGRLERVAKWCRRYPAVAALIAVSVTAALVASGLAWWAVGERDAKEASRLQEEQQRKHAEAITGFVKDDFLALSSLEGQERFGGGRTELPDLTMRQMLDAAAEKLKRSQGLAPKTEAELWWMIGVNLRGHGEFARSVEALERSLKLRQAAFGPGSEEALNTENSLAKALCSDGRIAEAIQRAEKVRNARLGRKPPGDAGLLAATHNLAQAYLEAARHAEAIALLEHCRDVELREHGAEDRRTQRTLDRLAWAYQSAGRVREAIAILEKVHDWRVRQLGADHSSTACAKNNLAFALVADGRHAEAFPLFADSHRICSAQLGPDHPSSLAAMNNWGMALKEDGRPADAIGKLRQAHAISVAKFGPDHMETTAILSSLALALQADGRWPEAVQMMEKVRAANVARVGPNHPDSATALHNLAAALREGGKIPEALRLFDEALEARRRILGPDHPATLATLNSIAVARLVSGDLAAATKLFEEVHRARAAKLGADHLDTLHTLMNWAGAIQRAGRHREAIAMLEQARAGFVARLGQEDARVLEVEHFLAFSLHVEGRTPEAILLFEKVRQGRKARLGIGHHNTLATVYNLACIFRQAGRRSEALAAFEEAAEGAAQGRFRWEYSDRVVRALIVLLEQGQQHGKAEAWRRRWLDHIRAKSPGSLALAQELADLGQNLAKQEKWPEAEVMLREAHALRAAKEPEAWTTFNTRSQLGGVLARQNRRDEAEKHLAEGYAGLSARAKGMPYAARTRLVEAGQRYAEQLDATNRQAQAEHIRLELLSALTPPKPPGR